MISLPQHASEVARSETQAVLSLVSDPERRGRLADLLASIEDGELPNQEAQALEEVLGLGLVSGRIRRLYGAEGERAAISAYRRLPSGREQVQRATEVSEALGALAGRTLDQVNVQTAGPGCFLVTIASEGLELSIRLDRQGARLQTVGV